MLYQAPVSVKTNSAGQEYRFVIPGIDGDLLQIQGGGGSGPTAHPYSGVSTQFVINDIDPGNNERISSAFRTSSCGNPAIFYVDDGNFAPGLQATTVGEVFQRLYNDATVNHAGRSVWEDEKFNVPYLTLDFDASLDSMGPVADPSDVSLTFGPRMTYLQVLDEPSSGKRRLRGAGHRRHHTRLLPPPDFRPGSLGGIILRGFRAGRLTSPTTPAISLLTLRT